MKKLFLFLLVLVVLAALYGGYTVFQQPNTTNTKSVIIKIKTGSTYNDLLNLLREKKLLKNEMSFELVSRYKKYNERIKPGNYVFSPGMNNRQMVNMLKAGLQVPVKLVIYNIRTKEEFAGLVGRMLELDSVEVLQNLNRKTFCDSLHCSTDNILSIFIADNYEFYWDKQNTDMQKFMEVMREANESFWTEERLKKVELLNFTKTQVVTLASIVEKEVIFDKEMTTVAGVYLNRLNIGMPLQADPTLVFATRDFDTRRVTNYHKEFDSPYNTYKYPGLPPGPICIPRKKSIDAVLNADEHKYLYFCANPDMSGYSIFSENYEQQMKVAAMYRKKLNAMNIH